MIKLEDGLCLSGRCVWAMNVGWITHVGRRTYRVKWLGGEETTQLRPDLDDEEQFAQGAE
jgi:hypothetical protein